MLRAESEVSALLKEIRVRAGQRMHLHLNVFSKAQEPAFETIDMKMPCELNLFFHGID